VAPRAGVRLRRVLLGLQVGLTVVLLTPQLAAKTYARLRSVDIGCATHDVLTMGNQSPQRQLQDTRADRLTFTSNWQTGCGSCRGVQAAAVGTTLPGEGRQRGRCVHHPRTSCTCPGGRSLDAATYLSILPYFTALKIPLLDGRVFAAERPAGAAAAR